jgi:multimeric flavodoxin WrbA
MNVIALNGSPRKNWNTAKLLENALKGAKESGAHTELIHLYSLNFKGCKSCLTCKRTTSKNYGKCCIDDDLKPLFEKIEKADALILGSPIYFRNISGEMMSFMERFLFPKIIYSNPMESIFKGNLKMVTIYTMNVKGELFNQLPLKNHLDGIHHTLKKIFGNNETLHSFFTYQTDNYADMEYTYFDLKDKKEYHEKIFPLDCQRAYQLGQRIAVNK